VRDRVLVLVGLDEHTVADEDNFFLGGGIHMEYLIHNYLPSNCRNQEDVCAWVYTNWRKYA